MTRTRQASIAASPLPGGWTTRRIAVGQHNFEMLVPANPDELLDHLVEPLDRTQPHLADPYWAKLWPAAEHLAAAILQTGLPPHSSSRSPPMCLELGCGSGLAGLAALVAGYDVTFSDYVPQAVELALDNAARNGFSAARGLVLDWRRPPDAQFALIIAADVTYDRTNLAPLLNTLDRMLGPDGWAWLADAGRGPVAEFLNLAMNRGWSLKLLDEHGRPAQTAVLGRCQQILLRRSGELAPA